MIQVTQWADFGFMWNQDEAMDELVSLWHDGQIGEDLELEDVIRFATDWTHAEFQRWCLTGHHKE